MSSLRELFNKNNNSTTKLSEVTKSDLIGSVESEEYIDVHVEETERFIPDVDFSDPKNFAKFGLAERYYLDAIKNIYTTFPYDGSKKERVQWELSSSFLERHILANEYPRFNGYAVFRTGSYTSAASASGYHEPNTNEYILTKGGPGLGKTSARFDNNVYNFSKGQECNLKIGEENTVEFYLKKTAFTASYEVVFDAWTTGSISSSADYGRLRIELCPTASASPWRITWMSGTSGVEAATIGASSLTTASVADDSWHHYSFRFKNSGSTSLVDLFIDGTYNASASFAGPVSYVSGSVVSTIGALCVAPSGNLSASRGWGPLSASIDEFRFWKSWRTSKEIERNYFAPVYGGTNTDDANTDLGVYYKFNEGITGTSSYDGVVLDYSGRVSNGTWTGYHTGSRSTGSAIVLGGFADTEYEEPTVYSIHPDVVALEAEKGAIGREWDERNSSALHKTLPAWLIEESQNIAEEQSSEDKLVALTQIMASYFDSLEQTIKEMPKISHGQYISSSGKPYPFYGRLLKAEGFDVPELFADATVYEFFNNRNDEKLFEEKIVEVKNTIYQNLYSNLVTIYKSKGTEKGFRNLLRCFGVDEELYRINTYAQNNEFEVRDNYFVKSQYKKYANFNTEESQDASIFGFQVSTNSDSVSYVSASATTGSKEGSGVPLTLEADIIFPKRYEPKEYNTYLSGNTAYSKTYPLMLTASLFGMHAATGSQTDLTWPAVDYPDMQVLCIKDSLYSDKGYFMLSGSTFGTLTSSYFDDLYADSRWNFTVTLKPTSYPFAFEASGSSGYTLEFRGLKQTLDYTDESFVVSGSLTTTNGRLVMATPKRFYVGAHKTNFTGSTLTFSDVKVGEFKAGYYVPAEDERLAKKDVAGSGRQLPQRAAFSFEDLSGSYVPREEATFLHWNFDAVTASNSSGEFLLDDMTSGSSAVRNRYGWFGNVLGYQHTAKAVGFPASSETAVTKEYLISAKKELPEYIHSSDFVNVLTKDDTNFDISKKLNTYFMLVEKSMNAVISDEMVKMFATVKDFSTLIGRPELRYRQENHELDLLRTLFFEKIGNTPDIEKFIDYFKWLDAAVTFCLTKMMPATSNLSEDYARNVVESHILERNKHRYAFPFFKDKSKASPSSVVIGSEELSYNWKYGRATANSYENCTWQSLRSRVGNALFDVATQVNNEPLDNYSGSSGIYSGSILEKRLFKNHKISSEIAGVRGAGNNTDYISPVSIRVTGSENVGTYVDLSNTGSVICTDYSDLEKKSTIKNVSVYPYGSTDKSVGDVTPFKLYSGSTVNQKVTNMHRDLYLGFDSEPMQSPWTEKFVGGQPSRHQFGAEYDNTDRTEIFHIEETGSDFAIWSPKKFNKHAVVVFRDEVAKRYVSLKNVAMTTSSFTGNRTVLGNFTKNWQVVSTFGRGGNNRYLTKTEGVAISGTYSNAVSGTIDWPVPQRTVSGSFGNHVVVTRFSPLGGPETDSEGFLDAESGEYSVYAGMNYRNQVVREFYDSASKEPCGQFGYDNELVGILLPSTMSGTYDNSASFHKVHRNRLRRVELSGSSTSSFITASKYDNDFVQYAIPRSDRQYSWITSSVNGAEFGGYQQPNFAYANLASTDYPNHVSGAAVTTGSALIGPLGVRVADSIDISNRLLEIETAGRVFGSSVAERLYLLNLYRNSNAQWASWKQLDHAVLNNYELATNIFLFDIERNRYSIYEPVFTTQYGSFNFETVIGDNSGQQLTRSVAIPYGNELVKLSRHHELTVDLANFMNETKLNKKFDNFKTAIFGGNVLSYTYNETIFPREQYLGIGTNRRRDVFDNGFWRTERSNRETQKTQSFGAVVTGSKWLLDARNNFATTASYSSAALVKKQGEGELQNNNTIFHLGTASNITAGPLYTRRIVESASAGILYSGDTLWEAGTQAGVAPFFDTYKEFSDDVSRAGKDYSILPEFRISEHMAKYLDENNGNFLADVDEYLSITGSTYSSSADDTFYKKFSTTEFFKYLDIADDVAANFDPSRLKLTCKAKLKLLPYDGFYPAQRTVQLTQLFSASYGDYISITGSDSGSAAAIRPVVQPLFTPGIMYNTIKAGLAVDYPVFTQAWTVTGSTGSPDNGIPRIKSNFDYRVPFEAIIEPEAYIRGMNLVDQEPHPSASLNTTASLLGAGSAQYKLAAHNFFGESINFFLKDGSLTTYQSLPDIDPNFGNVTAGKKYMMRLVCSHAKYRSDAKIAEQVSFSSILSQSYEYNPPTITMYKNIGVGTGSVSEAALYGAAFGPPADITVSVGASGMANTSASYHPYTPPYYGGYSHIELTYVATGSGKVSVEDVLVAISSTYQRYDFLLAGSISYTNRMQLTASLNAFQKQLERSPIFDSKGNLIGVDSTNTTARWVIQPKFETPVLDFTDVSYTTPVSGAAGISKGMWHQYGVIPSGANKGIFLEIQDLREDEITDSSLTGSLADLVGFKKESKKIGQIRDQFVMKEAVVAIPFYVDMLGREQFFKIPKKIIENAELFLNGRKDLFDLETKEYPNVRPNASIINMVDKMREFVIPPKFDFIKNKSVDPMAMYIFDFDIKLSQTDLSKIWQNIAPEATTRFVEQERTIEHNLKQFSPEGFELIDEVKRDIQWLVFRVKQKAEWNYFARTADTNDDVKFNFKVGKKDSAKESVPDYSYNWPYDFCSIIELGKIEASVKFEETTPTKPPKLQGDEQTQDKSQIINSVLDPYKNFGGKI